MSYVELEDGTRVYDKGLKYKPKPAGERKNKVRRPDDPRYVRFRAQWLLPLEYRVVPLEQRALPETREKILDG